MIIHKEGAGSGQGQSISVRASSSWGVNSVLYSKNSHIIMPLLLLFLSMYEKHTSLILQVLEYTNLSIIIVFLLLFTYRLQALRSYSLTDKFKNYFPKLRIFYCLAYVALSVSLISYNLSTDSYSQNAWYEYVLQGGGGECIDSAILVIQLGVLRLELKKQQPYTRFHLWYFVYLMIISFARFTLTLIDTLNGLNDMANLIISSLLVADSTGQFVYWIKNRQSLPEFISHTHEDIDESRYQSQFLQKRAEIVKRSMQSLSNDHFPYINAFVAISHGKLRVNLQRNNPRSNSIEILYDENGLNESFLSKETNLNQQYLASNEFTIDEIKKLYTICGRFQLKKQLNFSLDMRSFIKELESFLNDLFSDKKCYVPNILKFLKVPHCFIESYQQTLEKLYLLQGRSMIDAPTGLEIHPDRNGIYFSLNLYRFMWVYDHYEYYMKISTKGEGQISYPIKRIQEIEELHQVMRKIVKTSGKLIELPNLPKIQMFLHRDDDLLKQHLQDVEVFLRKLVNDEAIMQDIELREKVLEFLGYQKDHKVVPKFNLDFYQNLKILKGRISKALIRNQYVTLYEFKLRKNNVEVGTIMKRFREIDILHRDIERWMRCRRAVLGFNLPEKVLYKTEIRHEKLKNYLQSILQIKDLWRCYAASAFFETGKAQQEVSSFIIPKSQIRSQKQRYTLQNSSLMADLESFNGQIQNSPPTSRSSKMFSKIIDDLGNEDYD